MGRVNFSSESTHWTSPYQLKPMSSQYFIFLGYLLLWVRILVHHLLWLSGLWGTATLHWDIIYISFSWSPFSFEVFFYDLYICYSQIWKQNIDEYRSLKNNNHPLKKKKLYNCHTFSVGFLEGTATVFRKYSTNSTPVSKLLMSVGSTHQG